MISSHDHHVKGPVCLTRPPYRNGKKLRAVKVYTIAQESKYLLIQNLPAIVGVEEQLFPYLNQYGKIEDYWKLDEYRRRDSQEDERFFETVLIKFVQINQARLAKCKLDDMNFMGSCLHICYAPECETVDDLREKLLERRTIVERKSHFMNRKKPAMKIGKNALAEQTTNEIRTKMRDSVQKSNLVSLVLQQEIKKKKRLQI